MSSRPNTLTNLNPSAPDYKPVTPGVTPNADAPPPYFLLPSPPHAAAEPQVQPFLGYAPRQPLRYPIYRPLYLTYNSCYIRPQSIIALPTHTSLPPPPLQGEVFIRHRRPGVGCNWPIGRPVNLKVDQRKESDGNNVLGLYRDEELTTVMIKNIPYVCSRQDLITALDKFCSRENSKRFRDTSFISAYDFVYLPIDFSTKRSRGFAFVNFINTRCVWDFFKAFQLKRWPIIHGEWNKTLEIVPAKIQGKRDLIHHFSGSTFECDTDDYLPVSYNPARDGSGLPVEMTVLGNRGASYHTCRTNHKAYKRDRTTLRRTES